MNNTLTGNVKRSFWITGALMLIWNVMGVANFFAQMNPEILAAYRESERAIVEGRPAWATAGFAFAVFGGTIGCILLLIRKAVARYCFIVSLLGVIVTMIHTLGAGISFSAGELLGIILMPLVVAAFLIWYSIRAEIRGWISWRWTPGTGLKGKKYVTNSLNIMCLDWRHSFVSWREVYFNPIISQGKHPAFIWRRVFHKKNLAFCVAYHNCGVVWFWIFVVYNFEG